MRRLLSLTLMALWFISPAAFAQLPGLVSQPLPGGGQSWSLPVQTLVFITSLTFLPAILLMMTSFTRIIIVFGLLRNALGTPSAPPNQVLLGLALFLTFFIMSPVIDKIYVDAWQPFSEEKISMQEALEKGAQPLREFMLRQTREADLGLFARLANSGPLQGPEAVPMRILLPAYVTSELKTAFQIGFTIFIPFLIIDLVIASVLMALGMMMVPPATIALPFKLMLFCPGRRLAVARWLSCPKFLQLEARNDTRIGHDDRHGGNEGRACACRASAAGCAVYRPYHQYFTGRHPDQRNDAVIYPENCGGIYGDYCGGPLDA